jgi:REP element-mobilizing transposase RayT
MARPLRLEAEGAIYHVIARGNERKPIFLDARDRQVYLDRLISLRDRFGFRILGFCLMDNHVHLALERGPAKLSRVMLTLQSAYTQWFNRRHDRVGHLFQGRYKSFLVERDRYLLGLILYIHRNPVAARVVERAEDFQWSSDQYYRRARPPAWLDTDRLLPLLASDRRAAIASYRRLMGEEVVPAADAYETQRTRAQAIKGDEQFAERILRQAAAEPAIPLSLTEAKVASVVARELGLKLADLKAQGRQRETSRARIFSAYLARMIAGISVARMAKYFGREESTLVRGVLGLEERLGSGPELRRQVSRLAAALRRK